MTILSGPLADLVKVVGSINIPRRQEAFDPESFFMTSPGLVVQRDFRSRALPFALPVPVAPKRSYVSAVFRPEVASRWRIQLHDYGQLPNHCYSEAVDIAWLLNKQGDGEPGFLQKSRRGNFFLIGRGIWLNVMRYQSDKAWAVGLESEATVFRRLRTLDGGDRFIFQAPREH